MANIITQKKSATPSAVPAVGDLQLGELAINTNDGKLFLKKDDGAESIVEIGAGGGGTIPGDIPSSAINLGTTDLDTVITPGFYYQPLNSNTPGNNYPVDEAGSILVQKSAGYVTQLYINFTNGGIYTRTKYLTSWYNWRKAGYLDEVVPLAGGVALSSGIDVASNSAGGHYSNSAIEVREYNYGGAMTGAAAEAPAIAWHWGVRVQGQLSLESDGIFTFRDGVTHSSLKTVRAASYKTNDITLSSISDGSLYNSGPNGYLRMGPRNSSWCHMDTDAANGFYFYSQISGTSGIYFNASHASEAASASKLVMRSSSGYAYAVHFNTSAGATGTVPTNIYAETNGDGWIRKYAISSFRTNCLDPYYVQEAETSEANGGSKVVRRNSSGDIFTRLFRSEYTGTTSSGAYFMMQHAVGAGADNYLRPATIAQALSSLGLSYFGTNTNGRYVRFPDGTQICTDRRDAESTWTFPAAFSTTTDLAVTVTPSEGNDRMGFCENPTTSNVYVGVTTDSGNSSVTLASCIAIGRWK